MLFLLSQQPPIVLLHGFTASFQSMEKIKTWLTEENFTVVNCEIGNGSNDSIKLPIPQQALLFQKCLESNKILKDGFIGVGHSQGGVIMRYYLQMLNKVKMLRLVTLASPLAGYFCNNATGCKNFKIPPILAYSAAIQKTFAPSNYWRDPLAYPQYVKNALALPLMNNERDLDEKRKKNFMSVDKIVMFGSAHDQVIKPYQSSFFGFYQNNNLSNVQTMEETDVYKQDLFGLKTMNEQGRMVQRLVENFLHSDYNGNETFVKGDLAKELIMNAKIPTQQNLGTPAIIGIAVGVTCFIVLVIIGIIVGVLLYRKKSNIRIQQAGQQVTSQPQVQVSV